MKTTIRKGLLITGTVLVIAGAMPTFASASDAKVSVKYAPAELEYQVGRERVYHQIETAARRICGSTNVLTVGSVEAVRANDECFHETVDRTVSKIGNHALTALHQEG
jgi:UrcA family protein